MLKEFEILGSYIEIIKCNKEEMNDAVGSAMKFGLNTEKIHDAGRT